MSFSLWPEAQKPTDSSSHPEPLLPLDTQTGLTDFKMQNTRGWVNSFGTFQTYYTQLLNRPPSDVSWIGSINVFLLFFVGTLTGRLVDAGYFRAVFLLGTVLLAVGIFTVSICSEYWHFLLAHGLCLGLSHGCLFCPTLAVLSSYFLRRRALALGIAACGSVTGGLVFPSMVRQLLPSAGFAWTVRAIGFVQVATMILANFLARPRIKPRKAGPLVEWSAFKELEYTFYAAGAFFVRWMFSPASAGLISAALPQYARY